MPDQASRPQARAAGRPLEVALGLLRADLPAQIMGAPQDWPRWAVLLPHVLTATGHRVCDTFIGVPHPGWL